VNRCWLVCIVTCLIGVLVVNLAVASGGSARRVPKKEKALYHLGHKPLDFPRGACVFLTRAYHKESIRGMKLVTCRGEVAI
jgi:hypothetical protein